MYSNYYWIYQKLLTGTQLRFCVIRSSIQNKGLKLNDTKKVNYKE